MIPQSSRLFERLDVENEGGNIVGTQHAVERRHGHVLFLKAEHEIGGRVDDGFEEVVVGGPALAVARERPLSAGDSMQRWTRFFLVGRSD